MELKDQQLIVAVVVQELAEVDLSTLPFGHYKTVLLPNARRRLSYYLDKDLTDLQVDLVQDALYDLSRTDGDLELEFDAPNTEEAREALRERFDSEYNYAVGNLLGVWA